MSSTLEEKDLLLAQEVEEQHIQAEEILNKQIGWRKYSGEALESKEAGMLIDYCKAESHEEENLFFEEQGVEYAGVFIKGLQQIFDRETKQYLVAKIAELLELDPTRAEYFHQITDASGKVNVNPYTPFFNYLENGGDDSFGIGRAAYCLAILLQGQATTSRDEMDHFFRWLLEQISTESSGHSRREAVLALKNLLKDGDARFIFVREIHEGFETLVALLRDHTDVQLLYLAVFCIWLLSYRKGLHGALHKEGVVNHFTEICKTVNREKVVRVCLATFVQLVDEGKFNEEMIGAGLPKVLQSLTTRKWKDIDLIEDLELLDQKLDDKIMELSSYEMYEAEVNTGALRWSPVHNEQFWRENHPKFDENNFDLIPKLINLLQRDDDLIVQVACYDLGEFARFHPDGKKEIIKKRGKLWLMDKMNHRNPDVQKQALLAVQKLMVKNWESLSSSGGVASLTGK